MLSSEIDKLYPYKVITRLDAIDRDGLLHWIYCNVPEGDWRYTFYYDGPGKEVVEMKFKDEDLAILFKLKF